MEKTINGITYVLVTAPNPTSFCGQCAADGTAGLCLKLGFECTQVEHEDKVWLEKKDA